MNRFIKAFSRLSVKDMIVFFLLIVIVIVMLIAGLIKLSMGGLTSDYPGCTLALTGDMQIEKDYTYDDLPINIEFPGSNIQLGVGGTNDVTGKAGTLFRYNDDFSIVGFVVDKNLKHTVDSYFPELLSAKRLSGYDSKQSGHGFMNTKELDYDAGLLRCADGKFYMVSYVYGDYGVSVVTRDMKKLKGAKQLLDRVALTMKAKEIAPVAVNKEDDRKDETSSKEPGLREQMRGETEAREDADRLAYELTYEGKPLTDTVEVTDELAGKDCVFVFYYLNVMTVPESAVLVSPSGQKCEAVYKNDDADGEVRFEVKNAEKGTYEALLSTNAAYGGYNMFVMSKEDWEYSSVPNGMSEHPIPRGGDD